MAENAPMRKHKYCPECVRNIVRLKSGPREWCAICLGTNAPHSSVYYKNLRRRGASQRVGGAGLATLLARQRLAKGHMSEAP